MASLNWPTGSLAKEADYYTPLTRGDGLCYCKLGRTEVVGETLRTWRGKLGNARTKTVQDNLYCRLRSDGCRRNEPMCINISVNLLRRKRLSVEKAVNIVSYYKCTRPSEDELKEVLAKLIARAEEDYSTVTQQPVRSGCQASGSGCRQARPVAAVRHLLIYCTVSPHL